MKGYQSSFHGSDDKFDFQNVYDAWSVSKMSFTILFCFFFLYIINAFNNYNYFVNFNRML